MVAYLVQRHMAYVVLGYLPSFLRYGKENWSMRFRSIRFTQLFCLFIVQNSVNARNAKTERCVSSNSRPHVSHFCNACVNASENGVRICSIFVPSFRRNSCVISYTTCYCWQSAVLGVFDFFIFLMLVINLHPRIFPFPHTGNEVTFVS